MYRTILIPLENTAADETILKHIKPLARSANSKLVLIHVADGWVARNYDRFQLAEGEEIQQDRIYLEKRTEELRRENFEADYVLNFGEPADEIVKVANEQKVDLIAMSTHGHRLIGDLIHGTTADKVRHRVEMPVLMLKAKK